jgi:hypothetical protein
MSELIPVDAVREAAGHLAREWGDVGYSIGGGEFLGVLTEKGCFTYAFECGYSDGSRWFIVADRYGNCASGDTIEQAAKRYADDRMAERARREAQDADMYA